MNLGPWLEWAKGLVALVSLLAVAEVGVVFLRLGGRGAAGQDPES